MPLVVMPTAYTFVEIARDRYVVITVPIAGRPPDEGAGDDRVTDYEDEPVPEGQPDVDPSDFEGHPLERDLVAMSHEDALSCWSFSLHSSWRCRTDMAIYTSNHIFTDFIPEWVIAAECEGWRQLPPSSSVREALVAPGVPKSGRLGTGGL